MPRVIFHVDFGLNLESKQRKMFIIIIIIVNNNTLLTNS